MFDIGFSELFVIAIVALLVLGPERLPKAARFAGLWVRRARAQWYSVKADLENELADDELKRNLQQARDQLQGEMRDLRDGLQHRAQAVQDEFTLPGSVLPPAPGPAPAANVMPPAQADERAPGATGSAAEPAAGDTSPVENIPVGSTPIERAPIKCRPGDSQPGDSTSADGAHPASPPGEAHDEQR